MDTIEMWIMSPAGKHLATIKVPECVSNVAWGDKDGKTLYITASTSLYRLRLPFEISHGTLSEKIPGFDPDLQILLCESRHLRADTSVSRSH